MPFFIAVATAEKPERSCKGYGKFTKVTSLIYYRVALIAIISLQSCKVVILVNIARRGAGQRKLGPAFFLMEPGFL